MKPIVASPANAAPSATSTAIPYGSRACATHVTTERTHAGRPCAQRGGRSHHVTPQQCSGRSESIRTIGMSRYLSATASVSGIRIDRST
eukprot:6389851-Prymnesium_polylepis.1